MGDMGTNLEPRDGELLGEPLVGHDYESAGICSEMVSSSSLGGNLGLPESLTWCSSNKRPSLDFLGTHPQLLQAMTTAPKGVKKDCVD